MIFPLTVTFFMKSKSPDCVNLERRLYKQNFLQNMKPFSIYLLQAQLKHEESNKINRKCKITNPEWFAR